MKEVVDVEAESAESAWNRLRPVLDASPEMVWWQARMPGLELTHVSQGVSHLLGFEPSRLVGDAKLWPGRVDRRDRGRVLRARGLATTLGSYQDLEYRLKRADGEAVWVRENAVASGDGYLHGLTIKVSDRKRTEERLGFLVKASTVLSSTLTQQRLVDKFARLIAGSMADICILELIEGDTNPGMVLARGSRKMLTKSLQADGPTLATRTRLLQRLQSGQAILFTKFGARELSLLAANERQKLALQKAKPHAAMVVPMLVRAELIGAVTMVCFNQTSYTASDVQLAEDLCRRAATAIQNAGLYARSERRQNDLLQENEAKDEFLAIMSHELRSPLTMVYGNSSLLARGLVPIDTADGKQMVQDMAESAERLVHLTDELMLLARVRLGEQPDLGPVLIEEMAQEAIAEFTRHHTDRRVLLSAARGVKPVLASQTYLRQVLLNLLGNAHKYCPPSAAISVKVKTSNAEIVTSVADSGEGLPQEEIDRIFDRFYRAENAHEIKGTGIGLLVCRTLVEVQGGRIWAGPAPEGGLEVSFSLPVAPAGAV